MCSKEVNMSSSLSGWGPTGRVSGLKGTGMKQITMPTMSPEQSQLFSQLLGGAGKGLGQGGLESLGQQASGNPEQFAQMEAPAMRQFNQLQGGLSSRFSGMGSGARNSSGFQNSMGEAGASLAEQLSSKRIDYQQEALRQLLGLSNSLLGKDTFNTAFMPKKKKTSFLQELLGAGASGLGSGLGSLLGLLA